MPFVKRNEHESDRDEEQEIRDIFDDVDDDKPQQLSAFDRDLTASLGEEAPDEESPRSRASKKSARKLLIGGAIAVGVLLLLSWWARPVDALEDDGRAKPEPDAEDPDLVLSQIEVELNAIAYLIDGVMISPIGDGPAGFLLAAGLEQRGAIPGETVVVLDFLNAPHAHAAALLDALRERGYEVSVKKAVG